MSCTRYINNDGLVTPGGCCPRRRRRRRRKSSGPGAAPAPRGISGTCLRTPITPERPRWDFRRLPLLFVIERCICLVLLISWDGRMMDRMLFFIECSYNANTNDQNPSVIICPTITVISSAKPQVQPSLSCALLLAEDPLTLNFHQFPAHK